MAKPHYGVLTPWPSPYGTKFLFVGSTKSKEKSTEPRPKGLADSEFLAHQLRTLDSERDFGYGDASAATATPPGWRTK